VDEFRTLLRSRLRERGALARLSQTSGIASHVLGRWRDGDSRPSDTNLKRLAPALGVSYEALARMCGYLPDDAGHASSDRSPDESELLAIYRQVPNEHRSTIKDMLRGLIHRRHHAEHKVSGQPSHLVRHKSEGNAQTPSALRRRESRSLFTQRLLYGDQPATA
jgi:transcriptional regulator with XRE-family HTH domain